jgi:hypothetical protein
MRATVATLRQEQQRMHGLVAQSTTDEVMHQTRATQITGNQAKATEATQLHGAHQSETSTVRQGNQQGQQQQQSTAATLAQYAERRATVRGLQSTLRVFQGFTWLVSQIPIDAVQSRARSVNGTATRFNDSLTRTDAHVQAQMADQAAHSSTLQVGQATIDGVLAESPGIGQQIAAGVTGNDRLQQTNDQNLSTTTALRSEATSRHEAVRSSADHGQSRHDLLSAQLATWAGTHRAEREAAVAQAAARYGQAPGRVLETSSA